MDVYTQNYIHCVLGKCSGITKHVNICGTIHEVTGSGPFVWLQGVGQFVWLQGVGPFVWLQGLQSDGIGTQRTTTF